jgi:hypothetical protein
VDWRAKVELFEQVRREYEFGIGTIQGVSRKFGVHRRMVREALANALPAHRKKPERKRPKLAAAIPFIDTLLEADRKAPRKQRHTARRIHQRIRAEFQVFVVSKPVLRHSGHRKNVSFD